MSVLPSSSPNPSEVPKGLSQSPVPSTSDSIFLAANKALENLRGLFEDRDEPSLNEKTLVEELTRSISPDDLAKMSPEHRRLFTESLRIAHESLPRLGITSKKALEDLLKTVRPGWQTGVVNKQSRKEIPPKTEDVQQTPWQRIGSPTGERRSPESSPLGRSLRTGKEERAAKTPEVAAAAEATGYNRTDQVQALAAFICTDEHLWNYEWVFRKEGDRELTKKFLSTLKESPPSKYPEVIGRLLKDAAPAGVIELSIALKRLSSEAMGEKSIRRSDLEQQAPALKELLTKVANSEKTKMGPEAAPNKVFPLSRLDKMFPLSQDHMCEVRIGDYLEKLLVVLQQKTDDPRHENFREQFDYNLDTLLSLVKEAPPKAIGGNPVVYNKLLELASLLPNKGQVKAIRAALEAAAKAVSD